MNKEGKIFLSIIIGSILLLGGLAYLLTRSTSTNSTDNSSIMVNAPVQGLEVTPTGNFDLGKVSYTGGVVTKDFQVKNNSDKDVTLRKITTSCMCTTAKISVDGKDSNYYGMEMNGDRNPIINYKVAAGSTATVTFQFDPKAHGPAGIGVFQRTVTLFFDSGYKDLNFQGTVVNI